MSMHFSKRKKSGVEEMKQAEELRFRDEIERKYILHNIVLSNITNEEYTSKIQKKKQEK